jgi:hypothetical protein
LGGHVDALGPDAFHLGGFSGVEMLADSQGFKPICATEMLENMAQILAGDGQGALNDLSDRMQEFASQHGWGHWEDGGLVLEPVNYQNMLSVLGISSHWWHFDVDTIRDALESGRPIGAFVDCQWLGYPTSGAHAITLTEVVKDAFGRVQGFRGIDSNFAGEERTWTLDQIARGVQSLISNGAWWSGKVLIPDDAARWIA